MNQPYNPKSTTIQKKDNKGLKTALLVAGTALLAYKGAPVIAKCTKAVGDTFNKGVGVYAKHCPNMAQAGRSLVAACKTPINGCKKIGSFIAKPFVAIGKALAKKP